ncbi:MAG: 4-hydroxythreonine-4-phosphate dehydrogenase PdxA [Bacteroidota bacterium]
MKLFVSCGDVNGIGLETFFKSIQSMDILDHEVILCIHPKTLEESGLAGPLINNTVVSGKHIITIHPCTMYSPITYGIATKESAKLAIESLEISIHHVYHKNADALITLPISKASLRECDWDFPGQTEMLSAYTNQAQPLMILFAKQFRVALATIHVPLQKVSSMISKDSLVQTINILHTSLCEDWHIEQPTIAVLGLNPHAGEQGDIGNEEQISIIPAIDQCTSHNIKVDGPFSADAFFAQKKYQHYDAVLAMYHDQGLIPLKMISDYSGVNATVGLPIIRMSPDHGTAYDIAGKNIAHFESTKQAILSAIEFAVNRA